MCATFYDTNQFRFVALAGGAKFDLKQKTGEYLPVHAAVAASLNKILLLIGFRNCIWYGPSGMICTYAYNRRMQSGKS